MHTFTFLLAVICLIHFFHGAKPSCSRALRGNSGTKSTSSVISRPFTRRKIAKTPLREIKAPLSTEKLNHILVRWELLSGLLDKGQDILHIAFQSVPVEWYSSGNHSFSNFMKTCQNKRFIPRPCQLAEWIFRVRKTYILTFLILETDLGMKHLF